jgi:hypothetical protein
VAALPAGGLGLSPGRVLGLQRLVGNAAVQRTLGTGSSTVTGAGGGTGAGSTAGAGAAPAPGVQHAQALRTYIGTWLDQSAVPLRGRSQALRGIDGSVQTWLAGGSQVLGALQQNAHELGQIQNAIQQWRNSKAEGGGRSGRRDAIDTLDGLVQAAITEFNQRQQQQRRQQQQVAGRFGQLDPRLTRYARRQQHDVNPSLQAHAALVADRNASGALTAQSRQMLDQAALQHLQKQLGNVGDVTATGVTPQQVGQLMGQYQNPVTGQTRFPELQSYLDSGAAGHDQTDPADEQTEQRDVGGTAVTIHSDRTDSLRNRRIAMLEQAITKVQSAGYQVPPLTVHVPKYGRRLVVQADRITQAEGSPRPKDHSRSAGPSTSHRTPSSPAPKA